MLVNIFKLENRISSTLTKKAKQEKTVYFILLTIFFIISSYLVFDLLYLVCNIAGSIISGSYSQALLEFRRVLPQILITASILHISIYIRCAYNAKNLQNRVSVFKQNGVVSIVLGGITIVYVIINLITKFYGSLVDGGLTFLFPLDCLIVSIVVVLLGVLSIIYSKKLLIKPSELPYFEGDISPIKGIKKVLYFLAYLIVLFSFSSICYIPFVMNFSIGVFFNITFTLTHILAVLEFLFYMLIYCETNKNLKLKVQKDYSLIFLVVNLVVFILYLVALQITPNAPNLNAFGLLPIEYTASINVFPFAYFLTNIIAPLIAFIKSLKKTSF